MQRKETCLLTCASNEDSDQPAHPHTDQRLRCPHEETLRPWPRSHYILNPDQLDTDQVDPHQPVFTLGQI